VNNVRQVLGGQLLAERLMRGQRSPFPWWVSLLSAPGNPRANPKMMLIEQLMLIRCQRLGQDLFLLVQNGTSLCSPCVRSRRWTAKVADRRRRAGRPGRTTPTWPAWLLPGQHGFTWPAWLCLAWPTWPHPLRAALVPCPGNQGHLELTLIELLCSFFGHIWPKFVPKGTV
jgi:hypothetical protein